MKKRHITTIALFVGLLAIVGGGYQFYFKVRLEQYARDEANMKRLDAKLKELNEKFVGTKPSALISAWRGAIQPWVDSVNDRAKYFDIGNLAEYQEVPEETMPRFHYEPQYYKMLQALQLDAYNARISIPTTTFGVPTPEQTRGQAPSREEVNGWLRQLSFGINITRMLMQYGMNPILQVEIWQPRPEGDLVQMQTVGLSFSCTMGALTKFLNDLKTKDRYYSVDAIQIANNYLRYPDPPLQVQMLLTVAQYTAPPSVATVAESAGTAGSAVASVQSRMSEIAQKNRAEMLRRRAKPWWKIWLPF